MRYRVRELIAEKIDSVLDETTVRLENLKALILDEDYSREQIAEELDDIITSLC